MQSIAREGQDGSSSASKWNLAQRQYAASPLTRVSDISAPSFLLSTDEQLMMDMLLVRNLVEAPHQQRPLL
jgi:hypothetical protein